MWYVLKRLHDSLGTRSSLTGTKYPGKILMIFPQIQVGPINPEIEAGSELQAGS